ncbi:hypothetical protein [Sodalis praecaptivus]|uniref:hypothetical protein n=1 Tax=Sodalis praecaptivus TaxID=1239307 RepID=UPI00280B9CA6|nr:hypothetical protein [Sodalis praecaptivus]
MTDPFSFLFIEIKNKLITIIKIINDNFVVMSAIEPPKKSAPNNSRIDPIIIFTLKNNESIVANLGGIVPETTKESISLNKKCISFEKKIAPTGIIA